MYRRFGKRFLDILISGTLLTIASPILILAFVFVKAESPGPFFFLQERLGFKGKIFKILKIRTMTHKQRVVSKEVFRGDAEVTRVGAILRRFKIDELPQLLNVLFGDMSIIGPRPGLPIQLPEYNEDGLIRLEVKPGLTGLAQINGNIYLPWEVRWKYDRKYVENLSFLLDVQILFKTIWVVIRGEEKFIVNTNA